MSILGDVGAKAGKGKIHVNRCIELDAKSLLAHKVKFRVQPNTPFFLPLTRLFSPGSPRMIYTYTFFKLFVAFLHLLQNSAHNNTLKNITITNYLLFPLQVCKRLLSQGGDEGLTICSQENGIRRIVLNNPKRR